MNRDLEALLMAFDALLQAGADDADRLEAIFEQQLEDTLAHYPNLTKDGLLRALQAYHPRWVRAQQHPPTMPPRA